MLPEQIAADLGDLVAELEKLGLRVTNSRYDAQSFGDYFVDLAGPFDTLRLSRDRLRYIILGDEGLLKRLDLFHAFDDREEFQKAVLTYVRSDR
jgi:hypothetical protein